MAAYDAGEILLASEGSAGFGLDDAALLGGEVEDEFEGMDEIVGALHGAADRDSGFGVVLGDDAVVLDVELLLRARSVLAFDDKVGGLPDIFRDGLPILLHQVGLEGVGLLAFAPDDLFFLFGVLDGVDGGEFFVGDADGGYGGGEYSAVGVSEEEDGLFCVVDVGDGEAGVVFCEVDDAVFAWYVGGGDDGELVPGDPGVEGDAGDAAARDGTANGGAEPHAREGNVVDILGAAENLGCSLFADGGATNDLGVAGHRGVAQG